MCAVGGGCRRSGGKVGEKERYTKTGKSLIIGRTSSFARPILCVWGGGGKQTAGWTPRYLARF